MKEDKIVTTEEISYPVPNGQIATDHKTGKLLVRMNGKWNYLETSEDRIANLEEALYNVVSTAKALGAGDDWLEIEIARDLLKTTKYKDKILNE